MNFSCNTSNNWQRVYFYLPSKLLGRSGPSTVPKFITSEKNCLLLWPCESAPYLWRWSSGNPPQPPTLSPGWSYTKTEACVGPIGIWGILLKPGQTAAQANYSSLLGHPEEFPHSTMEIATELNHVKVHSIERLNSWGNLPPLWDIMEMYKATDSQPRKVPIFQLWF